MASGKRGIVRKRALWLFAALALLFVAIAGRLVFFQLYRVKQFEKWAKLIRSRKIAMPASRGCIYDRTGRMLAVSIQTASIFANPKEVKNPAETSVMVASVVGGDAGVYQARIESTDQLAWLVRKADPRLGDKVSRGYKVIERGRERWKRLDGVGVQLDTKRVYPAGPLAAHVINFTDFYGGGFEGAERNLDDVLRGRPGEMHAELDARRRVIPETRQIIRQPANGRDVYLTIDMTIQHVAEQAVARMARNFHPQNAAVVVMDPNTGEILALANYPSYDPNGPRNGLPKSATQDPAKLLKMLQAKWRNRAVADLYEPGSTLKAVTVAAGLNEGIDAHAAVARCTGCERLKGGRLPCSLHHPYENGHGAVHMYKIMRHSCNIGAAHVAMRLGAEKLRSYEKAFGLLNRADAGFGCEAAGWLAQASDWPLIQLANVGFGQGIAVTPLQMACVYATIANGGTYMQPRIVREVRDSAGQAYPPFKARPLRRVISRRAAAELTKMMVSCVEDGTGKNARIEGRVIAGKTGSAQIANPGGGGYQPGAFVASFIGFAPAYRPRLVIAVVVTKPRGSHYGAVVAAPVFREIAEKSLWYLKVPTDAPAKQEPKQNQEDHRKLV